MSPFTPEEAVLFQVAGRVENLGVRRPLLDGSIGPEGVKFASRAMMTPRAAMRECKSTAAAVTGAQSTWCVKTHAQVQPVRQGSRPLCVAGGMAPRWVAEVSLLQFANKEAARFRLSLVDPYYMGTTLGTCFWAKRLMTDVNVKTKEPKISMYIICNMY